MADRGLGDAQLVGGVGETHMTRGSLEGTQAIERGKRSLHANSLRKEVSFT
jgi:hypothetical protein